MKIIRLSEALGARVEGLDLSKPLDEATVKSLKQAWRDHLVLVFPDQHLTPADQVKFSAYFGNVVEHPMTRNMPAPQRGIRSQQREVSLITQHARTNNWHQDMSCMEVPFTFSLLYGIQPLEMEGVDDDTCFCNMYKAYDSLSPGLRGFLEPRRAVHSGGYLIDPKSKNKNYRNRDGTIHGAQSEEEMGMAVEQLHPCVRIHPETKKPLLYVNLGFTTTFEGWSTEESKPLIKQIINTATQDTNVYRHKWQKNDLLCWDNRAVMHLGPPSQTWPKNAKRYMVRSTVIPFDEVRPYGLAASAVQANSRL